MVWLRKFSDELAKNCSCSALEHMLTLKEGLGFLIPEQGP